MATINYRDYALRTDDPPERARPVPMVPMARGGGRLEPPDPDAKPITLGFVLGYAIMCAPTGGLYAEGDAPGIPIGVVRYTPWMQSRGALGCGCTPRLFAPVIIRHDTREVRCVPCAEGWGEGSQPCD